MIAQARSAFRIQRFEMVVAIVVTTVLFVSALVVRYRLDAIGVPVECWAAFEEFGYSGEGGGPCVDVLHQHGLINGDEAAKVMVAMAVVPWLLGFVLGVPLVAREIEGGTAPTVWALARSRPRWLAGRVVPVLVLVVVLLAALAWAADQVWAVRSPWLPLPSFDDVGLHGPVLIGKGIAALAVGLVAGLVLGRSLPAILLSVGAALLISTVSLTLMGTWFQSEGLKHTAPLASYEAFDQGLSPGGGTAWLAPDGRVVFTGEEILAFKPAGLTDEEWLEQAPLVQFGLPNTEYPRWVVIETVALGAAGLAGLLIAFPLINRRRPM